jgi:hypothetical protein
MIQMVPVLLVDKIWPQLQEGMAKACKKGGGQYTEGWLHTIARKGDAYLVADMDGETVTSGIVCQEQNWSGRIVLNLLACCGKPYDSNAFIEFARATFKVEKIIFEGRPGWGRTPGVRVVRHVYEMEI